MPLVEDLEQGRLVQGQLQNLHNAAASLYARAEKASTGGRVGNRLVRLGLSTFAKGASWVQPSLQRLGKTYGMRAVETLDKNLTSGYCALDMKQLKAGPKALVSLKWFQKVDAVFKASAGLHLPLPSFPEFMVAANASFSKLSDKTFEEFAEQLKLQMESWDDRYMTPARAFWTAKRGELTGDPKKQAKELLLSVKAAFEQSFVVSNARGLYDIAMDHYMASSQHAKVVAVADLVKDMKARLGNKWNDNLAVPLSELFNRASQAAKHDIDALRTHAEQRMRPSVLGAMEGVRSVRSKALETSGKALDYILPTSSEEEEESEEEVPSQGETTQGPADKRSVTFTSLAQTASKRLRKRATVTLGSLKLFSHTKVKSLIHIDLIQYAEETVTQASGALTQANEGRISMQGKARLMLEDALANAKTAAAATKAAVTDAASAARTSAEQRTARFQLKQRLDAVKTRARQLGAAGWKAVAPRKIADMPSDLLSVLRQGVGAAPLQPETERVLRTTAALADAVARLIFVFSELQAEDAMASPAEAEVEAADEEERAPTRPQGSLEPVVEEGPLQGEEESDEEVGHVAPDAANGPESLKEVTPVEETVVQSNEAQSA